MDIFQYTRASIDLKGVDLSSLTAIFGSSEEKGQDSDKLMDLYWNRAELKKEFAEMRKEQFRLKDLVKTREGATARLQQRLDHLEELLVDPKVAHNVLVYYQLRGLGHKCERKLARFAEQLKQQREQKRHDSLVSDWQNSLGDEAKQINLELLEKRDSFLQLEDHLQAEQRRLTSMSGFVRLFRGRSVMKLIDGIAEQIESAAQDEQKIIATLEEIKGRQPPDQQGLDVSAKRSINLMILAFAQQLYAHFDDAGVAGLIREATEKSVGAINYGTRHECEQLLNEVTKSVASMEQSTDYAGVLKMRVKLLNQIAIFSGDADAVPVSGSVATVFRIDEDGMVHESQVNLLSENYWGMAKILSR